MEAKKWYNSKIVLLAVAITLVFGGNAVNTFLLGNGVSQDQIDALAANAPEIAAKFQSVNSLGEFLTAFGAVAGPLLGILRIWFTSKPIASND